MIRLINRVLFKDEIRRAFSKMRAYLVLTFVALIMFHVEAAPVPIERVQKLAGGLASSVQVARSSGAVVRVAQAVSPAEAKVSAVSPVNVEMKMISRKGTGVIVSGGLLSCVFQQT